MSINISNQRSTRAKRTAPNKNIRSKTVKKSKNNKNLFNSLNTIPNSKTINIIRYNNIPFYYIKLDGFKSFANEQGLRAVILDNDETTGYYEDMIEYVKNYVRQSKDLTLEEVIIELKKKLIETFSLRPGYEEFLQTLVNLKESGRLDAVIMYTNMGKKMSINIKGQRYNRPQLLAAVFDSIIGKKDIQLFDLLIFRDKPYPNPEKYIAVINQIYEVENKDNNYLFLDDKPELIYNNSSKKQSKFAYKVNIYNYKHKGHSFTNQNENGISVVDKLNKTFV